MIKNFSKLLTETLLYEISARQSNRDNQIPDCQNTKNGLSMTVTGWSFPSLLVLQVLISACCNKLLQDHLEDVNRLVATWAFLVVYMKSTLDLACEQPKESLFAGYPGPGYRLLYTLSHINIKFFVLFVVNYIIIHSLEYSKWHAQRTVGNKIYRMSKVI